MNWGDRKITDECRARPWARPRLFLCKNRSRPTPVVQAFGTKSSSSSTAFTLPCLFRLLPAAMQPFFRTLYGVNITPASPQRVDRGLTTQSQGATEWSCSKVAALDQCLTTVLFLPAKLRSWIAQSVTVLVRKSQVNYSNPSSLRTSRERKTLFT